MTVDPNKQLSRYGVFMADLNRITTAADTATLHSWFASGMPLDVCIENNLLFHHFVSRGSTKMATEMLLAGISPDITNAWNSLPSIFNAVRNGKLEDVRMLVWGGADVQVSREFAGTLLHEALSKSSTNNHEVVERLVVEGVPLKARCNELTAEQKARRTNTVIARKMRAYMKLEDAIDDQSLSKEQLTEPFKDTHVSLPQSWAPLRFIDMNVCWSWMDKILPVLERSGESVTREEIMESPKRLAWVVIGGGLDALDQHLKNHGGRGISMDDFVKPNGAANAALDEVIKEWGEKRLLASEWVKEQSSRDFKRLLSAMPESKVSRMRNHHQLAISHERQHKAVSLGGHAA